MKPKVFISYSRSDAKFVKMLSQKLKRAALSAWFDINNLIPGTEWQPELEEALRTANAVVVCLSPKSSNSAFVTFEWSFALGAGVKVFPVLLNKEAAAQVHPSLRRFGWIDLSGKKRPWAALINALKTVPRARRNVRPAPGRGPAAPAIAKAVGPRTKIGGPELIATFEMAHGKPMKIGDEYSIALTIKGAPAGTKRVDYELLDDTFDEPRFHVNNPKADFEGWISSYGDFRISAKGRSGKKPWATENLLSKALRKTYGRHTTPAISRAIATIERA